MEDAGSYRPGGGLPSGPLAGSCCCDTQSLRITERVLAHLCDFPRLVGQAGSELLRPYRLFLRRTVTLSLLEPVHAQRMRVPERHSGIDHRMHCHSYPFSILSSYSRPIAALGRQGCLPPPQPAARTATCGGFLRGSVTEACM